MAKESPEVTEKVDKLASDTGEMVIYHNAYVPAVEHKLPKAEWDRLAGEKLLGNAVFIRSEFAK